MNRRQLLSLPLAGPLFPAPPPRSNIVIFLADDLGWNDVGYHGSEIRTPRIDRLAGQGVRFERFCAFPLCSPTRTALMTGRS
ncbi:MAG: sulfatase-like hydrolase/transferase, partial [Acidobacteria bacterium]|nr:sulfatase-like hydrolase/transferase [Acidobacteriota bacterium]